MNNSGAKEDSSRAGLTSLTGERERAPGSKGGIDEDANDKK